MPRSSPLHIEGTGLSYRDPDDKGRPTVAMVRAKDEQGRWQCRRFAVTSWNRQGTPVLPPEALTWARQARQAFIKGETTAGTASFQEFAAVLAANLAAAGKTEDRVNLIKSVSAGLEAAGIVDMKALTFPARVREWITGLKVGWSLPEGAKNQRINRKPLSNASRNKLLIVCRQVTGLAVRKRRLVFDPLSELESFKVAEHHKPLFTVAELRHMVSDAARDTAIHAKAELEAAIAAKEAEGMTRGVAIKAIAEGRQCHPGSIYNALNREAKADPWWLPCCLLLYTGARAQEAMHLRWEWIKWDARIIDLKLAEDYDSKGDRERKVPLEPELDAILRPIAKPAGHILPPEIRAGGSGILKREADKTGGGKKYTEAFHRYLRRIGIDPKDRTAHSLRHCYITLKLAREDTNVERLRKAVGHRQFSTTQGYGELSQDFEAEVDTWPDRTLWLRRAVVGKTQAEAK